MESADLLSIIGIVLIIASALMLAGGIVLLVLSIRSTIRKKKRIGGIVWGGILIFMSVMAFIYGIMMIVLNGAANSVVSDQQTNIAGHNISTAISTKDPDLLADFCAAKSVSGDEVEEDDAEELIDSIEGNVKSVEYTVTGFSSRNSTRCVSYKFDITTSEDKYTLYVDYITKSSKDGYVGIQRASLRDKDGKVCEFGKKPDLD